MRNQRGASLIVLVLVLAIVGLTVWLVVSYTSNSLDALAGAGAPLDDTNRQRTLADMKVIGDAIRLMQADSGDLPTSLAGLVAGGYLVTVPTTDGWGNALVYMTSSSGFELHSLGSDGRAGPAPPQPWTSGSHACDLIMTNGQFTQAPSSR